MARWLKGKGEKGRTILLHEAMEKGLVSFELEGAGGGSTSSVTLRITNLSEEPLSVDIPAGTMFSPKEQKGGQ